jgi:Ulp1 family protease catalytic subunit
MLELLIEDIPSECHRRAFIESTHFTTLLITAYNDEERYSTERCYGWIRDRGNQLANGSKTYLATIINQNNTHWVALVIDFDKKVIWYGDSTGHPMEKGLKTIIAWWTFYHTGVHFSYASLVIGIQRDSYSCGMLAWDALWYRLAGPSPSVTQMDPSQPSDERLKMFFRLVKHYDNKEVSDHDGLYSGGTNSNVGKSKSESCR